MSGYSEDIECPCYGWEGAQYNNESRGEDRGDSQYCDFCGWSTFIPDDEEEQPDYPPSKNIPNKTIIKNAKKLVKIINAMDDENEDIVEMIMTTSALPTYIEIYGWQGIIPMIFEEEI